MKRITLCVVVIFLKTVVISADYYTENLGSDYYMSDWTSPDWVAMGGRGGQPKCVDIPKNLTLCQKVGYDRMRLPNSLGHDSISEVIQQAQSWVSLVNIHCHPDTERFLCALFSPVCLDREILPCRSLCLAVKAGCETRMNSYGFPWPEMVRCDKFPLDNDLCINGGDAKSDETTCEACRQPDTFEGIIDNYCRADFVFRVKIKLTGRDGSDYTITTQKKKKTYKKEDVITKKDLRKGIFNIPGGSGCECNALSGTKKDYYLIMGKKTNNKMVMHFALKWDKKNKDIRRALRAAKTKKNLCSGVGVLTAKDNVEPNGKPKKKGKKGKKRRDKKKNKGGKKKKTETPKSGRPTLRQLLGVAQGM